VACSFQKESSVIMHQLLEIDSGARFFTLDTGLFFPETYVDALFFGDENGL
jgi:3'-phosphoadenosine 5'-phosphosulfate sulfotransferase (PAPS reductase)/FAD synthetase